MSYNRKPHGENSGDVMFCHSEQTEEALEVARMYCQRFGYTSETHRIRQPQDGTTIVQKK